MESLPDKLLLKIFRSLPVDARARLELVSPRWAQLLRSPELWTAITFDGVSATVTHEALAHIVCCAHGTLRVLDITAPACDHVTAAGLIAALAPQDGSLPAEQLAELITWRPGLPASGPARELSVLQAADIRRACPSLRSAVVELKVAAESCSQAMIALPSGGCAKRLSVRSFRNEPQIRSFCEWLGRQTDTIVHLDVTFTDSNGGAIPFRAVGAEAVALAVLAHPGLVSVVMPNNSLGPGGAQAFVRALAAPRCGLTTLDLASNELGDAGAAHLGPALTDNRSLTWLGLRGNGIGDGGAEVLASLLSMNTALLHLNLDKNSIGDAGATALARGLFRNGNLQTLSLGGNPFGDAGAEGLARALQRAKAGGAGLRTLNVNSTLISPKGACAIADSLERNTVLKSLRLDNVVVGDPGATSLGLRLAANTALTALDLTTARLGPKGAEALARALGASSSIKVLSLRGNAMGPHGVDEIARALTSNGALSTLNVADNALGPAGAQSIAKAVAVNHALTSLDVGSNGIGDQGGIAIARALEGNARLRTLIVESNELGFAAGEAFAKALVLNKSLTALSLMDNPRLGDAACEALNYSLYHNSSLKVLNVRGCSATVVNRALGADRELFAHALPDAMKAMRLVTTDLQGSSPKSSLGSGGSGRGGSRARSTAPDWPVASPTGSVASSGGGSVTSSATTGAASTSSSARGRMTSVPAAAMMHRAPGNRLAALNVGNAGTSSTKTKTGGTLSESEMGQALRSSHMRSLLARK